MPAPPLRGRFAPSPTGALHLGSLVTAIASYCHIKSLGGEWLLRMEDTDRARCRQAYADGICQDLERLGLHWDGAVCYQSARTALYDEQLLALSESIYGCDCTRKQLAQQPALAPSRDILSAHDLLSSETVRVKSACSGNAMSTQNKPMQNDIAPLVHMAHADEHIYPRYCLHKGLDLAQHKVRYRMPDKLMRFTDSLQGEQSANPQQTLGDMVLRRADGTYNYIFAASVDDGLQGITHILRGIDILPLTFAQICLMQQLQLPAIKEWRHIGLIVNTQGQKLSKQNLATPIHTDSLAHCQSLIQYALAQLRQPAVSLDKPEVMLTQATAQWDASALMHQTTLGVADCDGSIKAS